MSTTAAATRRPEIRSTSRSRKREVEAGVVGHEDAALREGEKAAHRELGPWRTAQRRGLDAGERGDGRGQRHAGVDERLERLAQLEALDALCADLADPRRARAQPGGLEVEDDERRLVELQAALPGVREPDEVAAAPGEAGVTGDDVVEQRPRDRRGGGGEREQRPRGLVGRQRPSPGLRPARRAGRRHRSRAAPRTA